MWRQREVKPLDGLQFPLTGLLGPGCVAVRETTTPHKNRTIPRYGLSSVIAITKGRSLYRISGHDIPVEAPGILIRPAGGNITHQGVSKTDCSSAYFCLTGPLSDRLALLTKEELPFVYLRQPTKDLRTALLHAVETAFENEWDSSYMLAERLTKLFRLLAKHVPVLRQGEARLCRRLERALDGDWSHPISVLEMAARLGMSRTEFYRKFRQETGMAPAEWVRHQRIMLATFYLRNGFQVSEVADLLHFSSPFAFSRMFKSVTGQRPQTIKPT